MRAAARSLLTWAVLFLAAIGLGIILGVLIALLWGGSTGAETPTETPSAPSTGWGA